MDPLATDSPGNGRAIPRIPRGKDRSRRLSPPAPGMRRFDGMGGVLCGPREAARAVVRCGGDMHSPCQPPASTSGLGATHWWHAGYVPPRQPHPRRPHARCCNSYQISAQSDAGPRWRDNATPGALPSRPRPAGTRGGSLLVRLSHSADAGISATMPEFPALWAGSVAPPLLRFCRRNHQRYSYLQRNPTSTRLRGTPYAFLKAAHARVAQAHQALQQRRRGSSRLSLTPFSPRPAPSLPVAPNAPGLPSWERFLLRLASARPVRQTRARLGGGRPDLPPPARLHQPRPPSR